MVPVTKSMAVFAICQLTMIFLTVFAVPTAALSVSEEVMHTDLFVHSSVGRSLLQNKKSCLVNFEFQNYTILTSQCKGPDYPANVCCSALKQFACPFVQYLNDETTDCSDAMFSYINLYGKYPPGLFANSCREGTAGLACDVEVPEASPSKSDNASNACRLVQNFLVVSWLVIISLLGVLVFTA